MQDERIGRSRPALGREHRGQLLFDLNRIVGFDKPDTIGDTQDVAVDGKAGNAEGVTEHHVGRLPSDTGQIDESVHGG